MKLCFENIGLINKGEVELHGLNIIGGENNTGKSTVGRLLYVLIKSLSFKNLYREYRVEQLDMSSDLIYELFIVINDALEFITELDEEYFKVNYKEKIKVSHISRSFLKQFRKEDTTIGYEIIILVEMLVDLIMLRFDEKKLEDSNVILGLTRDDYIRNIKDEVLGNNKVFSMMQYLHDELFTEFDYYEKCKEKFEKYADVVFDGKICNSHSVKESIITLYERGETKAEIILYKNKIQSFKVHDFIEFDDITIVDSLSLLQVQNLIRKGKSKFEIANSGELNFYDEVVSDSIKDCINKLVSIPRSNKRVSEVNEIINGKFEYSKENQRFEYIDFNGESYSIDNIASGIKNFGVLDMLEGKNLISEKTLIILEEPESNLHPKWQLDYASIIVELIKLGANILITSHSPYMIQALKYYTREYEIDRVNFYLADVYTEDENSKIEELEEMDENNKALFKEILGKILKSNECRNMNKVHIIKNVNKNTNVLFNKLTNPLKEIIKKNATK